MPDQQLVAGFAGGAFWLLEVCCVLSRRGLDPRMFDAEGLR